MKKITEKRKALSQLTEFTKTDGWKMLVSFLGSDVSRGRFYREATSTIPHLHSEVQGGKQGYELCLKNLKQSTKLIEAAIEPKEEIKEDLFDNPSNRDSIL